MSSKFLANINIFKGNIEWSCFQNKFQVHVEQYDNYDRERSEEEEQQIKTIIVISLIRKVIVTLAITHQNIFNHLYNGFLGNLKIDIHFICLFWLYNMYIKMGKFRGGSGGGRGTHPVIFHTKYPKKIRASLRSAPLF